MARRNPTSFIDEIDDTEYLGVIYTAEGLAIAELGRLREHYASLAEVCQGIPRGDYATNVDASAGEMAARHLVAGIHWLVGELREREAAAEARLTLLLDY